MKKKRNYKQYILPIFIVLILSAGFIIATTYMTEDYVKSPYFNASNSDYKITKTADVVVCRGTSLADDIIKSITCDVVCYYTENCTTKIQSEVDNLNGGTILFRDGVYPTKRINFNDIDNLTILGEGVNTVFKMIQGNDILFRTTGNSSNIEFGNFKIKKNTTSTQIVGIGFDGTGNLGNDNIYIHDIDFGDIGWLCWRIVTSVENNTVFHTNLKLERLVCNNASYTMGQINHVYMDKITQIGKSLTNNVAADIGYGDVTGSNNALDVHISNYYLEFDDDAITVGGIAHGQNVTVHYDNFVCKANNTCIYDGTPDATDHTEIIISNSIFEGLGDGNHNLVKFGARDDSSFIKVTNSMFDGKNGTQNGGLSIGIRGDVIGSTFRNFGQKCLAYSYSPGGIIEGNTFQDCAQTTATWRYINLGQSQFITSRNNHFRSTATSTNTVYALQNTTDSSISGDTFENINSTYYTFFYSNEWNRTYLDNYKYTTLPFCDSERDNPFRLKTVYNTTDTWLCSDGTWIGSKSSNTDINPITTLLHNLGSSIFRWLKLWVQDIDVSGNITMSSNGTMCYNINCSAYQYWNGTTLITKVN